MESDRYRALVVDDEPATGKLIGGAPSQPSADPNSTGEAVTPSELNAKLADVASVLPISRAALDVYQMTRSDRWSVDQIAAAIQRDASLAVDVLRMVNSSLYKPPGRRIASLDEAVMRIGQRRVGELALAANSLSAVTPSMLPWLDLQVEWKRSMAAGIALESLVEVGGHQAIDEGLMLSAIMHPLGRVALAMLFPNEYQVMIERCDHTGESLRDEERRIFPTAPTEVMAQLLSTWGIPSDVFLPLKFALDDFSTLAWLSDLSRTRTELLKVAIVVARLAVGRWKNWDLVEFPSPHIMKRLGIKNVTELVRQTRSDLEKLADFRPGGASTSQHADVPSVVRDVAYCNATGNDEDVLVELLPAMGLHPRPLAIVELDQSEEGAIVNCLGVALPESVASGGWSNTVFVTDQENREACESLGRTVVLPTSFGRLRTALLENLEVNMVCEF